MRSNDRSLGGEPIQGNIDSVRRNLDHSLDGMNDSVFDPGGYRPISSSTAIREEKGRFKMKRRAEIKALNDKFVRINDDLNRIVQARDSEFGDLELERDSREREKIAFEDAKATWASEKKRLEDSVAAESARYEKHAERIRRQTEGLRGERNAMVQENEQVRNDIKDSTSQMMDDRGILIKQCSELKMQRGKLIERLDELQEQIGDPGQLLDPDLPKPNGGRCTPR